MQVVSEKLLYDRQSAAEALSISVRSLDYIIAAKQIKTRRIGKKVLVPAGELRRYASGDHYGPINKHTESLDRARASVQSSQGTLAILADVSGVINDR